MMTTNDALPAGTIVRYAQPATGEHDLTFVVIEDRDTRVLVQSLDFPDWRFPPQENLDKADVVRVTE
jgi:hypothetical protein